ncbi:MAG: MarR family transcriptional regulator [Lachnospiraceae bacterium]|jgi:DNA-binding MarR family transcriptional regulator|nr:MarR family transcriptional regulator [Lachnospiraceae bacterium]
MSQTLQLTESIARNMDMLFRFIVKYSDEILRSKDYGGGDSLNRIEARVLTLITESPGVTVGEIAQQWGRTKGAASQQIKKLEEKGYIEKRKLGGNGKNVHLFATEHGSAVAVTVRLNNLSDATQTLKLLLESCSAEEIMTFYKVAEAYSDLMDASAG